jgi:predicted transcriptional regulator
MQILSVKSARRDRLSIIAEMLEIAKENVLKT